MKKKRNTALVWLVSVSLFCLILAGVGLVSVQVQAKEQTLIKIGIMGPQSGPAGPWGTIGRDPYYAFVELFNKEGFDVGGKNYGFQIVEADDLNTPEGGAAAAKKLIFEDKVKFIVGHWSWNFATVAAVTTPAKVILITRTGSDIQPVSLGGSYDAKRMPYVVFGNPSHEQFVTDCFALVKAFPGYHSIGLNDSEMGKGPGWDKVDAVLTKAGIRFHHEWYPYGAQDFTPYITRFAEAGCDIIYGGGDITAAMLIDKQRYEMGHKDWHVGTAGTIIDPQMYINVIGKDASEGFIGQYWGVWDYKVTKIDPKWIAMCKQAMQMASEKQGKPYTYTGWIGWMPNHIGILSQAMQKAGTVDDPDAIMKAIRGGTFSTTNGTFTMSGAKTYGSPVLFGSPGVLCEIKGGKEVYLFETPMDPIP
ncbi:MAG: ABC transporter substrate-binding protein [Syntrophobacteraceae bacterium]|jgi:branched-chain amino acid transport system substrate-binding protein